MSETCLEIQLSNATLESLRTGDYALFALLPVVSSNRSGVPLVWQCREDYLANIRVVIPETDLGYIATTSIAPDRTIAIGSQTPVACHQRVDVSASGTLSTTSSELPGIYFNSPSGAPRYTCGLARRGEGEPAPYCAFDLSPTLTVALAPSPAILVFFATSRYRPGTYLEASLGAGIYLPLPSGTTRRVGYDTDDGWQADAVAKATPVPSGTPLAERLIERPPPDVPLFRARRGE
ncbi:hypothetical protein [Halomonas sp. M4R1S46]|uniref:hypothetical protein n=1 Tax=Halomonas sp. M4R1S46 TaxID=2982692 RepID=UPI0021E4ACA9|nr:hypothetical protein [Halomonas sp. M4R1S46]UYG08691.1 hypothetical protein OCT48_04970 [Halomonas sp. M4R1S46]